MKKLLIPLFLILLASIAWGVIVPDRIDYRYNVMRYGATGDGTTDDRAAIQAALTAGAGKAVFMPEGTYLIKGTLLIPSKTSLIGVGRGSELRLHADSTMAMLRNSDTTTGDTGIVISGVTFNGQQTYSNWGQVVSAGAKDAVQFVRVHKGIVSECFFANCKRDALVFRTSTECKAVNNDIWNSGEEAISLSGASNGGHVITGNNIVGKDSTFETGGEKGGGILCKSPNSIISNNRIKFCGTAIDVNWEGQDSLYNIQILGNNLQYVMGNGIALLGAVHSQVIGNVIADMFGFGIVCGRHIVGSDTIKTHDVVISNNVISKVRDHTGTTAEPDAINIQWGSNYLITNNVIDSVGQFGIFVRARSSTLSGNKIRQTGNHGIVLYDTMFYDIVTGNRIDSAGQNLTISRGHGIYLFGNLATSEYLTVSDNVISSSYLSGIYADSIDYSTFKGNVLIGNNRMGNNSSGLVLSGGRYNTVSGNVTRLNAYGIRLVSTCVANLVYGNQTIAATLGDTFGVVVDTGNLVYGNFEGPTNIESFFVNKTPYKGVDALTDSQLITKKYADNLVVVGDTVAKVLYNPGTIRDSLKWNSADTGSVDTLTLDSDEPWVRLRSPDSFGVQANQLGIPGGPLLTINPDTVRANDSAKAFLGTAAFPWLRFYTNNLYLHETTGTDSWYRVVQTDGTPGYVLTRDGDSAYWSAAGVGQTDTLSKGSVWDGLSGFAMVADSLGSRKAPRGLIEGSYITMSYSGDTGLVITGAAGGGSDNDTGKVLSDAGTGTPDRKAEWSSQQFRLEDLSAGADIVQIIAPNDNLVVGDTTTGNVNVSRMMQLKIDSGGGNYYAGFYNTVTDEPGENYVWAYDATDNRFEIRAQTGGTGENTSAMNRGTGTQTGTDSIFYQESGDQLQFRRLKDSTGVVITPSGDTALAFSVDTAALPFESYLPLAGGTMSSNASVNMSGGTIINLDTLSADNALKNLHLWGSSGSADGKISFGQHGITAGDTVVFGHRVSSVDWRTFTISTPLDSISAENHKITMVADPTAAQDVATKNYVDTSAGGGSDNDTAIVLSNVGGVSGFDRKAEWSNQQFRLEDTASGAQVIQIIAPNDNLVVGDTANATASSRTVLNSALQFQVGVNRNLSVNPLFLGDTAIADSQVPTMKWVNDNDDVGGSGSGTAMRITGGAYSDSGMLVGLHGITVTYNSETGTPDTFNIAVDTTITAFQKALPKAGGTLSGDLNMGGFDILAGERVVAETLYVGADTKVYNLDGAGLAIIGDSVGVGAGHGITVGDNTVTVDTTITAFRKMLQGVSIDTTGGTQDVKMTDSIGFLEGTGAVINWNPTTHVATLATTLGATVTSGEIDTANIVVTRAKQADSAGKALGDASGNTITTYYLPKTGAATAETDFSKITTDSITVDNRLATPSIIIGGDSISDFANGAATTGLEVVSGALRIDADAAGTGLTGGGGAALSIANGGVTSTQLSTGVAGGGLQGGGGAALVVGFDSTLSFSASKPDSLTVAKIPDGAVSRTEKIAAHVIDTNDINATNQATAGWVLTKAAGAGNAQFTWAVDNTGTGEQDTVGIRGVPNGTEGFGMVSDSTGTRKRIRQLREGSGITLAYAGDTAVTITGAAGSTDTVAVGIDRNGGTLERPMLDVYSNTGTVDTLAYLPDNATGLIWTDSILSLRGKGGTNVGDTAGTTFRIVVGNTEMVDITVDSIDINSKDILNVDSLDVTKALINGSLVKDFAGAGRVTRTSSNLGPFCFRFSTVTTDGDPGNDSLRFNSGSVSAISSMYLDNNTFMDVTLPANAIAHLGTGTLIYVIDINNPSNAVLFAMTSVPIDGGSGAYWKIPLSFVDSSTTGAFSQGDTLSLIIQTSPDRMNTMMTSMPMNWIISSSTSDGDPSTGQLRFDNYSTQSSATKLYVDELNAYGRDIDSLTSSLGYGDILVMQKITGTAAIWQTWPIASATTDASGYNKINLGTQISAASSGSFAALDTVAVSVFHGPAWEYVYLTNVHGFGRALSDSIYLHWNIETPNGDTTYLLRDSAGNITAGDQDTVNVSGWVPYNCTIDSLSIFYRISTGSEIVDGWLRGPDKSTFTNLTDSIWGAYTTDLTSTTWTTSHNSVNQTALAGYRFSYKYIVQLDTDNDRLQIGWVRLRIRRN